MFWDTLYIYAATQASTMSFSVQLSMCCAHLGLVYAYVCFSVAARESCSPTPSPPTTHRRQSFSENVLLFTVAVMPAADVLVDCETKEARTPRPSTSKTQTCKHHRAQQLAQALDNMRAAADSAASCCCLFLFAGAASCFAVASWGCEASKQQALHCNLICRICTELIHAHFAGEILIT